MKVSEPEDFVSCRICGKRFRVITPSHLKYKHSTTMKEYMNKYPNAHIICKYSNRKKAKNVSIAQLGIPFSKERRQSLSKARIGMRHSLETRRKIGISKLGDKNPMKRPEVARRSGEAKKGKLMGNDNPMSRSEVKLVHLSAMRRPEYRVGASKRMLLIWEKLSYDDKLKRTLPGRTVSLQLSGTSRSEETLFLILQKTFDIRESDRNFCVGYYYFFDFFIGDIPLFWEDHLVRSWLGGGEENKTISDYYNKRRNILDMSGYAEIPLIVTQNRNWEDAIQYIQGCVDKGLQIEDRVYSEE